MKLGRDLRLNGILTPIDTLQFNSFVLMLFHATHQVAILFAEHRTNR